MEHRDDLKRKVPWKVEEDDKLRSYVNEHGDRCWDIVARELGLGRTGNSCRLRWVNYLSPDIERGSFTDEEMLTILSLHFQLGNKWSRIAQQLPGRTDNDIKNFWNTKVKKEAKQLNGGVESDDFLNSKEFLQIMTERLTEKMKAVPPPPPTTTLPRLADAAALSSEEITTMEPSSSMVPTTGNPSFGPTDDLWSAPELGNDWTLDDYLHDNFGL